MKKITILVIFTLLIIAPQIVQAANCSVLLQVHEKRGVPTLGHGEFNISSHDVILKPVKPIENSEECAAYKDVDEIHLNNVEQHHEIFQNLRAGDEISATINYHRPSPHGKMLYENFHYGLRILSVTKSESSENYDNQYIYFRHIGLY